ncbi:MAG: hypothetical protein HY651_02295 [Acidobacteria bacterium]|nr:hypothetical protein [Acidobacteriota bacterium]
MRILLLAFLRLLQYAVDIVFWGIILVFLIRLFGVLSPSAEINNWALVISLRKALDPVLTAAGAVVGM